MPYLLEKSVHITFLPNFLTFCILFQSNITIPSYFLHWTTCSFLIIPSIGSRWKLTPVIVRMTLLLLLMCFFVSGPAGDQGGDEPGTMWPGARVPRDQGGRGPGTRGPGNSNQGRRPGAKGPATIEPPGARDQTQSQGPETNDGAPKIN